MRHLRETIDRPDVGERFDVQGLIGQGGMGRVYQVHDRLLGRDVALKVLSLDAETASLSERLGREGGYWHNSSTPASRPFTTQVRLSTVVRTT